MKTLDKNNLPQHIAIIMDGNGRWAKKRFLNRLNGHRKGVKRAREIVKTCSDLGIRCLTLFAFSQENWNRPVTEVTGLMNLLKTYLKRELKMLMENNIRFRAIGNRHDLSKSVQGVITEVEEATNDNNGMTLCLALSYSGRGEIISAVRNLVKDVSAGNIQPEEITEDALSNYLYTGNIPDPDLLIRTSGEMRISNFMLWQLAYTEIYVTETLWPDFSSKHLIKAIHEYQARERRFGLTADQINQINPVRKDRALIPSLSIRN